MLCSMVAVSYKHLDVYKRQALYRMDMDIKNGKAEEMRERRE